MDAPFYVHLIGETITEESAARGDVDSYDVGEPTPCDVRAAMDALESQAWDYIDEREGEAILYPADSVQDMRTGAWTSDTLVIRAMRPEWLTRLLSLYRARDSVTLATDGRRVIPCQPPAGMLAGVTSTLYARTIPHARPRRIIAVSSAARTFTLDGPAQPRRVHAWDVLQWFAPVRS